MELRRTRLCPWKPVGIDALAFSPSGTLAVGRENGAMELWDSKTWHLRCSSPGKNGRSVVSIIWVPGSETTPERLLSAGLHREITEWDVQTLEPIETATSGGGAIWSLAMSKDNSTLFCACDDGSLRILSLEGGVGSLMYKGSIQVEQSRLLSVAVGSEPGTVFAGGSESRISKWSVTSKTNEGNMMVERPGNGRGADSQHTLIWRLLNLEDEMLASGDSIGLVYIWDIVACVVLQRFAQHQGDVTALCSNGELLMSGGIDAKIAHYTRLRGSREERWLHSDVTFCHSHDIRAIAIWNSSQGDRQKPTYVSGGVAGNLFVQVRGQGRIKRPMECSAFSPLMHQVCFAQSSRFMLTQQARRLHLWYMKEPQLRLLDGELVEPEVQKVISIILARKVKSQDGSKETLHHLASSAIAPDGKIVAASEMTGTRLFDVNVEQLQVRRTSLPTEISSCPMRAMCFAGRMLVMATWHDHRILLLDCKDQTIITTFEEHQAPVTHLVAGGADHAEWLLSGDVAGAVKIWDLDALALHCSVPTGEETVTALAFDASGRKALLVNAQHQLNVFDIESQSLEQQLKIPPRYLPPHARVCGVCSIGASKLLLWGHGFLLAAYLDKDSPRWQTWPERFILGLAALSGPWLHPTKSTKGSRPQKSTDTVAIAVQVSEAETRELLPEPFERKKYGRKRKAGS